VIRNLESTGRGTLFEVTGFLSNRISEEAGDSEAEQADPAPIQLMTIHGSKGLEFPMVVLPDMYSGDNDSGVQLYLADDDPDSFLWPALAYKPGDIEGDKDSEGSFLFKILKAERVKRQRAETKRLFYVAVTRAETHVLLSMTKPNQRKRGSFADLLEPWVMEQEAALVRGADTVQEEEYTKEKVAERGDASGSTGSGGREQKVAEIEWLTVEELVDLAAGPGGIGMADFDQAGSDLEKIRIPDRSSALFRQADARVSVEVRAASGKRRERAALEEDEAGAYAPDRVDRDVEPAEIEPADADPANTDPTSSDPIGSDPAGKHPHYGQQGMLWQGLSPADAGTLVHRTLEVGLDAGMGHGAESTSKTHTSQRSVSEASRSDATTSKASTNDAAIRELEHFWKRELIRMNVADPGRVVAANAEQLLRHCRNARHWINTHFGQDSSARFEVAFEVRVPMSRVDGDSAGSGSRVDGDSVGSGSRDHGNADRVEKNVTIRGSIDMVVRDKEGQMHIVDFKTGPVPGLAGGDPAGGESTLVRHARDCGYDQQIRNYLIAWEALHGKSHKMDPARVWLLFTAPENDCAVSLADF